MKITNNFAKGKWIHVKINGVSYKKWIAAYSSIILPEVTRRDQLNLNAHEEAIIHTEEHTGHEPDPTPTPEFYYIVQATSTGRVTGGTTSLSGASVTVAEGLNLSFSVYPDVGVTYLSAYTVNDVAQTIVSSASTATTVYTLSSINQDKNIVVSFGNL